MVSGAWVRKLTRDLLSLGIASALGLFFQVSALALGCVNRYDTPHQGDATSQ
jgi:hypothetical protein